MRLLLLVSALAAATAAQAAETPMKKPSPAAAVASLLRFQAPAGWRRGEYANSRGADPVVEFEKGADRIAVYVYGAPGSSYKTPADFLGSPAATTMGRAPDPAGSAVVAGRGVALYRRRFPLADGDPHAASSAPPRFGSAVFCVLPPAADGRFAVLTYARESPIPGLDDRGEKSWNSFLKTVRVPGPKSAGRQP